METRHVDLLVLNAGEVATPVDRGRPCKGREMSELRVIPHGAIAVERGRIVDVGKTEALRKRYSADVEIDADGRLVVPGFVDPHTHVIFAGSREDEFVLRLKGVSYMEIHKRGGGILKTVRMTREASEEELLRQTEERLKRMVLSGTTTVEVKSGYGLDTESELKMLRVAHKLAERTPLTVVPTFLGAHAIPPNMTAEEYTKLVVEEMIPRVAREGLAKFNDVFIEAGFSREQAKEILLTGKSFGLEAKVHADEFSDVGGAELAAEVGAVSADHLVHSSQRGLKMLAEKRVVGVVLPVTSMSLGGKFANARGMIELGVPVALGTDLSPACWCESMQFVIALATHVLKLTPAEALTAVTLNAAYAVGLNDRGSLEVGKRADIVILDVPRHEFLGYVFGSNLVRYVIIGGRVVVEDGRLVGW